MFECLADAVNRGDRTAWMDLWCLDAVLMEPDAPILQGRQAFEIGAGSRFTDRHHEIRMHCRNIQVTGSLALATRSVTDRSLLRSGGEGIRFFDGKYLAVLLRDEGGMWKILRYSENSSDPRSR